MCDERKKNSLKLTFLYMVIRPLYRTLTDSLIKGYYIHRAFLLSLVKIHSLSLSIRGLIKKDSAQ